MKRIIFLTVEKLSKYNYDRLGIDLIQNRGYKVEVWDLSPALRPEYNNLYDPSDGFEFSGYLLFKNNQQIIQAITRLTDNDIVIWGMTLTNNRHFIYNNLKNIKFGFFFLGALPKQNLSTKEKLLFNRNLLHKILWNKLKVIFSKKKNMYSPSFIITGGSASTERYDIPIDRKTIIIKAHTLDFDRFLEVELSSNNLDIKEPFSLYIDQYIPFHPDNIYKEYGYGVQGCLPEKYFPEINRFFDWFEHEHNTKVIVAAHPSANYIESDNLFDGRKLVYGNTALYVKYAEKVLIHDSTAVNFAILYKKPVVFIKSNNYSYALNKMTQTIAENLGQEPINISMSYPSELKFGPININVYENYKNLYIKEECSPNKKLWDIVLDNFEILYEA